MERQFAETDEAGAWHQAFQDVRRRSCELPYRTACCANNRVRNRYRDVNPFDESRVRLQQGENDYINASLVTVPEAGRKYILTQGPLPLTCSHFWQMVWEQQSRAVVMLNRVLEKGLVKCEQYWPTVDEPEMVFDTGYRLTLASSIPKEYFTITRLMLECLSTSERREVLHFHYTSWPDFGVPDSPAAFLAFLMRVRRSGVLDPSFGPIVVHCSAGIGRSGTFCLVDSCLALHAARGEPDVYQVLLDLRKFRMGLIQTPAQLRFSFLAIIEGMHLLSTDSCGQEEGYLDEEYENVSREEWPYFAPFPSPPSTPPPPPPRPPKRSTERPNGGPAAEKPVVVEDPTKTELFPDERDYELSSPTHCEFKPDDGRSIDESLGERCRDVDQSEQTHKVDREEKTNGEQKMGEDEAWSWEASTPPGTKTRSDSSMSFGAGSGGCTLADGGQIGQLGFERGWQDPLTQLVLIVFALLLYAAYRHFI
uniref:tyrosine-protein phosphatase non-receptor type 1-like isoform X2 n=1 Tax=Myxine glutinosa TaxID=7769 RepID=UPI0035900478